MLLKHIGHRKADRVLPQVRRHVSDANALVYARMAGLRGAFCLLWPTRSNESLGLDALAQAKFYAPDGDWIWYASEFDGQDVFFGLVSGFEVELGYFLLSELEEVRGPMGLQIERDTHFEPRKLRELLEMHRNQRRVL